MNGEVIYAEYLFLDGASPTQQIRSKTRLIPYKGEAVDLSFFPEWSFDGSSTYQAKGKSSDLLLQPVNFCLDLTRSKNGFLVMCEVLNPDKSPHPTNKRALLRELWEDQGGKEKTEVWLGFEQEHTLFQNGRPLGWPQEEDYPEPQGPFYCGVGSDRVFGRDLVEEHMFICQNAGLCLFGVNAEVMPGQWEFQIGYRGEKEKKGEKFYQLEEETQEWVLHYSSQNLESLYNPLNMADHLWMARWFLHRIAENYQVKVSFENKPVEGNWNGAGLHTNFSTKQTRAKGGLKEINRIIKVLASRHKNHIENYGAGLEKRLTGLHETCHIDEFKHGFADRGASIRIPADVKKEECGYLEDRRPGANANPYVVAQLLLSAVFPEETSSVSKSSLEVRP